MLETALLDVRVLPWRPRARVMRPETLREGADPGLLDGDDVAGLLLGLAVWVVIIVAAPLVVCHRGRAPRGLPQRGASRASHP